jgi:hypothetical protein
MAAPAAESLRGHIYLKRRHPVKQFVRSLPHADPSVMLRVGLKTPLAPASGDEKGASSILKAEQRLKLTGGAMLVWRVSTSSQAAPVSLAERR